jgi:hypothetical protein
MHQPFRPFPLLCKNAKERELVLLEENFHGTTGKQQKCVSLSLRNDHVLLNTDRACPTSCKALRHVDVEVFKTTSSLWHSI